MTELHGKSDFPTLELKVILAHYLNQSKTWVASHPETLITPEQQDRLDQAVFNLSRGIPLPYITGIQEFYGIPFKVSEATLIPRPETELLVDLAIKYIRKNTSVHYACDIGTGCGNISISIAKSAPFIQFFTVDSSFESLKVAYQNIRLHSLDNQVFGVQGDLLYPFGNTFDLICANLPYIPTMVVDNLRVSKFEPRSALDGGMDGLTVIRRLIELSPRYLNNQGLMLLEFDKDQEQSIYSLALKAYPGEDIKLYSDLSGHPRILSIFRQNSGISV